MYCTQCGKETEQKADNLFACAAGHDNWINPVSGSTLAIFQKSKVLFGIRADNPGAGKLDLPGGFINLNESLEKAASREAKEELGVEIEIVGYIGSYPSFYVGNMKPVLNVLFAAIVKDGEVIVPADDLARGYEWRSLDNWPDEDEFAFPWQQDILPDVKKWMESYGRKI